MDSLNNFIIKSNCIFHILHDTAKYSFIHLHFDVEYIVLKIYAHFATSAERISSLKSVYELTDNENQEIRRHSSIRWLTLYPAIERLIENINEIHNYFIDVGTDNCPTIINEFVWSESVNYISIPELYLHFAKHLMKLFFIKTKFIAKNSTNATNLYDLIFDLRTKLENRLTLEFYGSVIKENIIRFSPSEQKIFIKSLNNCYQRAIDYLTTHFDFNNTPFKLFKSLNLDCDLNNEKILSIVNFLNIC